MTILVIQFGGGGHKADHKGDLKFTCDERNEIELWRNPFIIEKRVLKKFSEGTVEACRYSRLSIPWGKGNLPKQKGGKEEVPL